MTITATELKLNLGKYLKLAEKEDVYIMRSGKITTKLCNPNQQRINAVKALRGILPIDIMFEESREERLNKI